MKKIISLVVLILLASIGGYSYYRQQPEQQVGRAVGQFLKNVEHRKISTRRQIDVHEALSKVLAAKVDFQGAFPIPTETLTLEETLGKIDQLHVATSLCRITESERNLKIIGAKAQVYLTANILLAAGKEHQREQTWDLIIDLEKGEDWRCACSWEGRGR